MFEQNSSDMQKCLYILLLYWELYVQPTRLLGNIIIKTTSGNSSKRQAHTNQLTSKRLLVNNKISNSLPKTISWGKLNHNTVSLPQWNGSAMPTCLLLLFCQKLLHRTWNPIFIHGNHLHQSSSDAMRSSFQCRRPGGFWGHKPLVFLFHLPNSTRGRKRS